MIRLGAVLAVASLLSAAPAAAQTASDVKQTAVADATIAEASRESEAFGQWLLSVNNAAAPALESVRELQGAWGQTMSSPNVRAAAASFIGVIDRTRADIARSRTAVEGIATPTFAAIDLPDDLQPTAVKQQTLTMLTQIDATVAGFPALLDAMLTNDEAAGRAAAANLFRSAAVLYDSQRLFARAALATSQPDTSDYHAARFEVLFFEAGGRMIDTASRLVAGRTDPALPADLLRYADQIDAIAEEATATARAAKQAAEADAATAGGQRPILFERAQRIEALSIENIGIWRRYSAALRTGANQMANGQVTFNRLQTIIQIITPTRVALDDVGRRQIEILAGNR